jgi:transcriptional regulator PpsR
MAAARVSGSTQVVAVGNRRLVLAPLRYEPGALIVRFSDQEATQLTPHEKLVRAVESMPDAFLVTDLSFVILVANAAFVTMAEAASLDHVVGSSLERWLGRPGVDLSVIRSALSEGGNLTGFATVVQGDLGQMRDVEVSAVRVTDARGDYVGLCVRPAAAPETELAPRSAQQIADLVGRVPIKEIVRKTTDTIERMCIEAALELSSDNRASAAELLGLSRQSLYVKMRRYGIVEGDGADPGSSDEV